MWLKLTSFYHDLIADETKQESLDKNVNTKPNSSPHTDTELIKAPKIIRQHNKDVEVKSFKTHPTNFSRNHHILNTTKQNFIILNFSVEDAVITKSACLIYTGSLFQRSSSGGQSSELQKVSLKF